MIEKLDRFLAWFKLSLLPYVLALLATAVTMLILYLCRGVINLPVAALLYLLPVGVSTTLWGLGPGIVAAIGVFLAFNFFFIAPYYSLMVHQTQDLLALVVFLAVAVFVNQLIGRARYNVGAAAGREHEALRLYEFSLQMAGLHSDQSIAEAIAHQVLGTFRADRVEVIVEPYAGQPAVFVRLPAEQNTGANLRTPDQPAVSQLSSLVGAALPADRRTAASAYNGAAFLPTSSRPSLIIPLQTARGLLGELRLWRVEQLLSAAEERLLRTFASQGVLALERARLLQADTRARVLEESDRLKSALLSSVSHELRTPLATIKASVTSLRSQDIDWDPQSRQELLAAIEEETDHLNLLVSNLLNMSRLEVGALKPQLAWNLLSEIVSGVVARQRRFSSGAGRAHQIEIEIPDDLPLVPVDYILMEQVFTNLLSNSLKYSPPGSAIRISARQIPGDLLLVQMTNQGPNVPEQHLERIFDKFYRVTAAERVTGTGLGLSICKGIVAAHSGRIWAENLPEGVAFKITLPLTWEGAAPRVPVE